jgi:hypothetical protein
MRHIRLISFILLFVATSPVTTFAGPPFLTDDPEPVPFKHWEFYLFGTVDAPGSATTPLAGGSSSVILANG